jgi:16S rRNA (cytosine967-C5)-methyltransferase
MWLVRAFAASGLEESELAALLTRAPVDLRINQLVTTREAVRATFFTAEPLALASDALRLPADTPVPDDARWEIQDAGSQLVAAAMGAQPGMTVLDLCAGGGGKTLALAAMMANRGRIVAADVDRGRLSRLAPRAAKAGVTIAEPLLMNPGREAETLGDLRADAVLVDAPCSGTGTWRRNPEARWRLTPALLARYGETQARLLDLAAAHVRPGGAVVHVVCSLLDAEGADQVDAFLARHPGWSAAPLALGAGRPRGQGVRLTPLHDTTDGFFVARLIAP